MARSIGVVLVLLGVAARAAMVTQEMDMEDLSHLLSEPDHALDAIMADDAGDEDFTIFLQAPVKAVHRYKDNAAAAPGQLTMELKLPLEGGALSYKNIESNFKSGLAQALSLTVASIQKAGEPVQESGNTVVDFNIVDDAGNKALIAFASKFTAGETVFIGSTRIVAMVALGKEATAPNLCPSGKKPETSMSGVTVCYPDTAEGRALKTLSSPRSKSHQAFKCNVRCARGAGGDSDAAAFLEMSQGYRYNEEPTALQSVQRSTCEVVGGLWSDVERTCLPFMVATQAKMDKPSDVSLDTVCRTEVGPRFGSCLVNEALGLAHLFNIRDHTYFWLKSQSGGVGSGFGIRGCSNSSHMAFYHNWDHKHVDEYKCLEVEKALSVLCCRRR